MTINTNTNTIIDRYDLNEFVIPNFVSLLTLPSGGTNFVAVNTPLKFKALDGGEILFYFQNSEQRVLRTREEVEMFS